MWLKTVRNIIAEAAFHTDNFEVAAEERFLFLPPPYHIFGFNFGVLIPLLRGAAAIVLIPSTPPEILSNTPPYTNRYRPFPKPRRKGGPAAFALFSD